MTTEYMAKSWYTFFFNHGWWIFLLFILNEKFGFSIFMNMLYSDIALIEWTALLLISIFALGIPAAMIGLTKFNINPWIGTVLYVFLTLI